MMQVFGTRIKSETRGALAHVAHTSSSWELPGGGKDSIEWRSTTTGVCSIPGCFWDLPPHPFRLLL